MLIIKIIITTIIVIIVIIMIILNKMREREGEIMHNTIAHNSLIDAQPILQQ